MLDANGFLGTAATLGADITLVAQILLFVALIIGIAAQRRQMWQWHDRIMTPVVIINLLLVIFIMIVSFREEAVAQTLPQRPDDPHFLFPGIHALVGIPAVLLSIYVLLAGHKILPRNIGRLRYWMWATAVFWTLSFLVGIGTYYRWYVVEARAVAELPDDIVVDDPADLQAISQSLERVALLQQFVFAPQNLTVVKGTTVTWRNQDGAPHNVTFPNSGEGSDNFFQGETYSFTFDEVGVIPVYCTLHGNPTSGMAGTVTVLEATEDNLVQVAREVAEQPLEVPPAPTPVPRVPPAPLALLEPTGSGGDGSALVGILSFRDHVAPSDTAVLALSDIPTSPAGSVYRAYLTAGDGRVLDMGTVAPEIGGELFATFRSPDGQNLMARFNGVQIAQESVAARGTSAGTVLYSGRQATAATDQIRLITVAADTPDGRGYGIGARLAAEELIRHISFIKLALELGSLADAQRHSEHVINLIEGRDGELAGDHDGAHGAQHPGDGFGILTYLDEMAAAAESAAASDDATRAIIAHADHVTIAAGGARDVAINLRDLAFDVINATAVGDIDDIVADMDRLSQRLLLGEDENGDGRIGLSEAGIFIAYQHAQYMGAIGLETGDALAVVDPVPITDQELPDQIAGGEVVVDMRDFDYSIESLTIPAGTDVRFVNIGQARHGATADDRSFDTGLFGTGGEASFTFDEPGFYPYFCTLHGTEGGVGMAASITVVEPGAGAADPGPAPTPPAPEPEPTGTPMPELGVEMLDFTYSDVNLVLPAGSEVTWFNAGVFEHSVTSDNDLFDTGLLKNGEQASLSFDTPGTFPYYCTLHGAPGGQGMAGTITVLSPEAAPTPPRPTATPRPPTATPAAATPTPVAAPAPGDQEMLDFTYSDVDLIVPVGSEVTWFNSGAFQHSVTADDGSFDTGLLGNGEEATLSFNTVGTFPFYCTLHGAPGGSGMSGTVTVQAAPTPQPTATPVAAPTPAPVIVDMLDFVYDPLSITVPAGTTISWFNAGVFKHSTTSDTGLFDTGLYDAGLSADITFDQPGIYPYYCTLHGAPGGIGMAGEVIVTDN